MYFDLPLLEELVLMQQQLKSVSRPRGNLSKRTVIIDEKHVVGCLELVVSHSSDALSSLKLLTPWMDAKSMLNTHKWANRVTIAGEDMMIVKENRINWCCWMRFKAKVAVICRLLSIPTNTQPVYHGVDILRYRQLSQYSLTFQRLWKSYFPHTMLFGEHSKYF